MPMVSYEMSPSTTTSSASGSFVRKLRTILAFSRSPKIAFFKLANFYFRWSRMVNVCLFGKKSILRRRGSSSAFLLVHPNIWQQRIGQTFVSKYLNALIKGTTGSSASKANIFPNAEDHYGIFSDSL